VSGRIDRCFDAGRAAGRKLLIPFMTAGDPDPGWTVPLMHALVEGGADLIELGVPFSDPMADGPVIQASSERALQHGVDLARVLEWVRAFREDNQTCPVVLMGYMNPCERFGYAELAAAASAAGVDGMLLVDCPPEEMQTLQDSLDRAGIDTIRLVAPTTTEERLQSILASAGGFVYYVSFKGITGAGHLDVGALAGPIGRIRAHSDLPVAVGFGIKDAASATAVAGWADAVVVGSALVDLLDGQPDLAAATGAAAGFVASIRQSLDNMTG
jgi:tryptophan synthase alpha chain